MTIETQAVTDWRDIFITFKMCFSGSGQNNNRDNSDSRTAAWRGLKKCKKYPVSAVALSLSPQELGHLPWEFRQGPCLSTLQYVWTHINYGSWELASTHISPSLHVHIFWSYLEFNLLFFLGLNSTWGAQTE